MKLELDLMELNSLYVAVSAEYRMRAGISMFNEK